MKSTLIISLFIATCAVFTFISPTHAQKKQDIIPATHMWLKTGQESMSFVPVRSQQQCEMMIRQAATLNSSEGSCFNAEKFLKSLSCTKPVKNDTTPKCK
jgi:hypothetical protein